MPGSTSSTTRVAGRYGGNARLRCGHARAHRRGEGLKSIDAIRRHHELGAAAGGSIKTIKLGGCMAVMDAGHLMQGLDMQVQTGRKTAETAIASAAHRPHTAAIAPASEWDVSVTSS